MITASHIEELGRKETPASSTGGLVAIDRAYRNVAV